MGLGRHLLACRALMAPDRAWMGRDKGRIHIERPQRREGEEAVVAEPFPARPRVDTTCDLRLATNPDPAKHRS
jgi:hypothetical protein